MEYVQERITTLHDLTDPTPPAPTDRAAVVVPMTEREYGGLAAERVLSELERVDPARVVVPLRADADRAPAFRAWLREFDLRLTTVWCDAPGVESLLDERGLDGPRGKGRDVWLGLGVALDADVDYVVVHDGDTTSYSRADVPRLLFPLARGHEFSKGYYARVEEGRLYGRLFRLFYRPLIRALAAANDDPVLAYLEAFRYALAGEFAATTAFAERLRVQRQWGLEVATLGEAFEHAGFDGSAQVDLGSYEHDHRSVGGPTGLTDMSADVGAALLRAVEEAGVDPAYDSLGERYVDAADRLVERYAADSAFNGLDYDPEGERDQVRRYAEAVAPPGEDTRLPPWRAVDLDPASVRAASESALEDRAG